jgi:hypothetical protein
MLRTTLSEPVNLVAMFGDFCLLPQHNQPWAPAQTTAKDTQPLLLRLCYDTVYYAAPAASAETRRVGA